MTVATTLSASDLEEGWSALAGYRTEEALAIFNAAETHEAKFGRALALLAQQPVTEARVMEARRELTALADDANDDLAAGAVFYLGRIAQHHQARPDDAAAGQQYRRLLKDWPESAWAQAALSRLAILEIYALRQNDSAAERMARAGSLVGAARTPQARCELHQVLAEAIFYFRLPAKEALPHLLAAEKTGRLDAVTRPDVLVQIAEVSRLAGDTEQARVYYEQFLREFPRDQRHYMVKERLDTISLSKV